MPHENDLAVFYSLNCGAAIFFINNLALADVHRLELVLAAGLDLALTLCLKRDNREVIKVIRELDAVGIPTNWQVVARVKGLVPPIHLNRGRFIENTAL